MVNASRFTPVSTVHVNKLAQKQKPPPAWVQMHGGNRPALFAEKHTLISKQRNEKLLGIQALRWEFGRVVNNS